MAGNEVFIGKDILRLITIAMYNDPLVVYREYLQNAVDSIDCAVSSGFDKDLAMVRISLDREKRSIVIRDNGVGISARMFHRCMTSIGWSEKRHTSRRGLWGIGRLVGLAYCQKLIFKTKANGEGVISCSEWDGKKFKELLSGPDQNLDFSRTINEIMEIKTKETDSSRPSFFEVQMNGIVRHRNDALLNEEVVGEYISQVAPVPFRLDAPFRKEIMEFLTSHVDVSGYKIFLNKQSEFICRPHQKTVSITKGRQDRFSDIQCFEVRNGKDKPVAVGWILHHSYLGALKNAPSIRGFRVRSGNMQIGNRSVLSDIFPEERFNEWTVGELHIIEPRIMPNGQRSDFEDTPALRDIKDQLVPVVGKVIAQKSRANSFARNRERMVERELTKMKESFQLINKNIFSKEKKNNILESFEKKLTGFQVDFSDGFPKSANGLVEDINETFNQLRKLKRANYRSSRFSGLPQDQQKLVSNIIDLVYDNSSNIHATGQLISRIASIVTKAKRKSNR